VSEWPVTVNSDTGLMAFCARVTELYRQHRFITFLAPRIGADRSLSQNNLLHVWLTDCAAHYLSKHKREVTTTDLEGMKKAAKRRAYSDNGWPWLVHEIYDPWTNESKPAFTSSADWKQGEMFQFLTWLQLIAAHDGLVLESKGEYAKLQRNQNI
jgi:hypothetical protein